MPQNSKFRLITESAGAISIVLSLVFVGMELRHANNLAEADGLRSLNEMATDVLLARMNNVELNDLIARAHASNEWDGEQGFNEAEKSQLRAYFAAWTTYGESSWKYYERGIIAADQYRDSLAVLCNVFSSSPAVVKVWQQLYSVVADEFIVDVEQQCPALNRIE